MAEDSSDNGGNRPRPAHPDRQPSGADMGWGVTGTLLSGMAVWGGVGWLIDRWLDIRVFFPIGVILGVGVAVYVVVVKYGLAGPPPGERGTGTTPGAGRDRPGTQKGSR